MYTMCMIDMYYIHYEYTKMHMYLLHIIYRYYVCIIHMYMHIYIYTFFESPSHL